MNSQIEKVTDYIYKNNRQQYNLAHLAKLAKLSRFHFLRQFSQIRGETPTEFNRRVRIENSALTLLTRPTLSISEIAKEFQFSSAQNFSRAFKYYYGLTPRELRANGKHFDLVDLDSLSETRPLKVSKNKKKESSKDILSSFKAGKPSFPKMGGYITLENFSGTNIVFSRHYKDYTKENIVAAFDKLLFWGISFGHLQEGTPVFGIFWDNVSSTPPRKRRFDVGFEGELPLKKPSWVAEQEIDSGLCAVYRVCVKNVDFAKFWHFFILEWIPASGLIPDERPVFQRLIQINPKDKNSPIETEFYFPIKNESLT